MFVIFNQGGSGYARKITYEDIEIVGAYNPLIIDQHYHPNGKSESTSSTAVEVSDVTFRKFRGTSAQENAIQLNCDSNNIGCTNIVLDDINITNVAGGTTKASCTNAHATSISCHPYVSCLP